jgi:hypothetical protein
MTTRKNRLIRAGLLAAALAVTSPYILAGNHGSDNKRPSMEQMCEHMHEGKGRFNNEDRRAEMDKRHADMAERLKLNDEQRQVWDQMRDERQARHASRADKWKKKMEKRCQQSSE